MISDEVLRENISIALRTIHVRPDMDYLKEAADTDMPIRLSADESKWGTQLVLDAIKKAGGVVLLPLDDDAHEPGSKYMRFGPIAQSFLQDKTRLYANILDEV